MMRNNSKQVSPTRRSKQYKFRFSRRKVLLVSLRRFRTKPNRRSKKFPQFVLLVNNYPHPVREIAFQLKSYPPRQQQPLVLPSRLDLRPQIALPIIFVVMGLGGTLFFGLQAVQGNKIEPGESFSVPTPTQAPVVEQGPKGLAESVPTSVRIARLGIDYPTIAVGKQADSSMETPDPLQSVTGWYKYSPTPGEIGPSVIVGHVDNLKGPSVFWRLREVVAGDIVEVTRTDGSIVKFKVESLKQFEQANFPTAEVYGNTLNSALRLITCSGTFNRATGHYTENTVVYASLIET